MSARLDKLKNILNDNEAVIISGYPNIFYYSGFTSEDAMLVISHDGQYIVTDSRYTIQAREQAPEFELEDKPNALKNVLSRINASVIGYEEEHLNMHEFMWLEKNIPSGYELLPMQNVISKPRRNKDSLEIRRIAEAERLGDEAFSYIISIIKAGMTEAEIALELEFFMRRNGASSLSFDTIAASGKRSAMPHGVASKKIVENGDFLTLDFGCVLNGYCSDMTRTVAIGQVCDELKNIYNIVLNAQKKAISAIEPGKKCSDIDFAARSIIDEDGYGKNFGHGLGHSVGVEIHEAPSFSPKCNDIIEDGYVITVEPGIYIYGLGGVRIEDVVAIENGRCINLTNSPKELIIL